MDHTAPSSPTPAAPRSALDLVLAVVAVLLQLVAGWFVLASGLLAPLWAVALLGIAWLGACVVLWRGLQQRARWVVLVPIATGVVWGLVMWFGDAVLGWTA